jgi:hypothetical protein
MVLGDGIRRNIASVDPSERAALIRAFKEINNRRFPGNRSDLPAVGGERSELLGTIIQLKLRLQNVVDILEK